MKMSKNTIIKFFQVSSLKTKIFFKNKFGNGSKIIYGCPKTFNKFNSKPMTLLFKDEID